MWKLWGFERWSDFGGPDRLYWRSCWIYWHCKKNAGTRPVQGASESRQKRLSHGLFHQCELSLLFSPIFVVMLFHQRELILFLSHIIHHCLLLIPCALARLNCVCVFVYKVFHLIYQLLLRVCFFVEATYSIYTNHSFVSQITEQICIEC